MSESLEKSWADVLAAVHGHHKGLVDEGHVDPERLRLTVAARKEAVVQLRVKGLSQREIAATLGVPKSTVHDDLSETGRKAPETGQAIEVSEKDILGAARGIREERAREIRARNAELSKSPVLVPPGKFETIVVDPPWPMKKIELDARPDNKIALDYPVMTEAELRSFASSIMAMARDDCHMFMWTTQRFLPLAMELVAVYGFKYVLTMVWHKPGGVQPFGLPQFNCEFVIYGRKGTPRFIDTKGFPCCFNAPRREHSRKPDEFYDIL
jgi:N6-adenosine-specific RNA methylase IME4/DNA-binding transcriptional regulator YiaG